MGQVLEHLPRPLTQAGIAEGSSRGSHSQKPKSTRQLVMSDAASKQALHLLRTLKRRMSPIPLNAQRRDAARPMGEVVLYRFGVFVCVCVCQDLEASSG